MAYVTAPEGSPDREPSGRRPLPQRVRQASLAAELKAPAESEERTDEETWAARDQPSRSGAVIGAFQRQSRRLRAGDDASQPRPNGSAGPSTPTTEDR